MMNNYTKKVIFLISLLICLSLQTFAQNKMVLGWFQDMQEQKNNTVILIDNPMLKELARMDSSVTGYVFPGILSNLNSIIILKSNNAEPNYLNKESEKLKKILSGSGFSLITEIKNSAVQSVYAIGDSLVYSELLMIREEDENLVVYYLQGVISPEKIRALLKTRDQLLESGYPPEKQ